MLPMNQPNNIAYLQQAMLGMVPSLEPYKALTQLNDIVKNKKAAAAASNQQALNEAQKMQGLPTIAQQVTQAAETQGVGALPYPEQPGFAGGGLVAFADGGMAGGQLSPQEYQQYITQYPHVPSDLDARFRQYGAVGVPASGVERVISGASNAISNAVPNTQHQVLFPDIPGVTDDLNKFSKGWRGFLSGIGIPDTARKVVPLNPNAVGPLSPVEYQYYIREHPHVPPMLEARFKKYGVVSNEAANPAPKDWGGETTRAGIANLLPAPVVQEPLPNNPNNPPRNNAGGVGNRPSGAGAAVGMPGVSIQEPAPYKIPSVDLEAPTELKFEDIQARGRKAREAGEQEYSDKFKDVSDFAGELKSGKHVYKPDAFGRFADSMAALADKYQQAQASRTRMGLGTGLAMAGGAARAQDAAIRKELLEHKMKGFQIDTDLRKAAMAYGQGEEKLAQEYFNKAYETAAKATDFRNQKKLLDKADRVKEQDHAWKVWEDKFKAQKELEKTHVAGQYTLAAAKERANVDKTMINLNMAERNAQSEWTRLKLDKAQEAIDNEINAGGGIDKLRQLAPDRAMALARAQQELENKRRQIRLEQYNRFGVGEYANDSSTPVSTGTQGKTDFSLSTSGAISPNR